MNEEEIKKFGDLFKAITMLRAEFKKFGYDFVDINIVRGDNIKEPTNFPPKLGGLEIKYLQSKIDKIRIYNGEIDTEMLIADKINEIIDFINNKQIKGKRYV